MAKKATKRTGAADGQTAIGFEIPKDVPAVPISEPKHISDISDEEGPAFVHLQDGSTVHRDWLSVINMDGTWKSKEDKQRLMGQWDKRHHAERVRRLRTAVQARDIIEPRWVIDFKIYDPIFKSEINFPLHPSFFRKHPEGIVIKEGIYSMEGHCSEEELNTFYAWAGKRSDIKILGVEKVPI